MSEMAVGFSYGVLMDPLEKQANEQGFTFRDKVEFVEKLRDSYNMLRFHVFTDNQSDAILVRLHKEVVKHLKKIEQ